MNPFEKNYLNAVFIVVVLTGVILAYFIISLVRFHRRYVKLQKERIFAEITIQEIERKRIANDLHDSIGPVLSAVKLNINSIEINNEADQKIIDKTGKYLDDIIASMRQISYNLLPNTLERKGLVEAVHEFIAQVNSKHVLDIHFMVLKDSRVSREKEIHIFRIIQEIMHNTIKHAGAKKLQIGISEEDGNFLLLTKDDGKGFDVQKEKLNFNGLGLKSLESRSELLNGILTLESQPGQGTNYFLKIPLS
ncbi:MAG: sensor histidine kinase [Chitinophagaceae bacterium]